MASLGRDLAVSESQSRREAREFCKTENGKTQVALGVQDIGVGRADGGLLWAHREQVSICQREQIGGTVVACLGEEDVGVIVVEFSGR